MLNNIYDTLSLFLDFICTLSPIYKHITDISHSFFDPGSPSIKALSDLYSPGQAVEIATMTAHPPCIQRNGLSFSTRTII